MQSVAFRTRRTTAITSRVSQDVGCFAWCLLCACLRVRLCMDFTLVPVLGDGNIWSAFILKLIDLWLTCDWPDHPGISWSCICRLKVLWSRSAATENPAVRKGESMVDSLASALALAVFREKCMIQVYPTWILHMSPPTHQNWPNIFKHNLSWCHKMSMDLIPHLLGSQSLQAVYSFLSMRFQMCICV